MEESASAPPSPLPASEQQQQQSVNSQLPPPAASPPVVAVTSPNTESEASSKQSNTSHSEQSGATQTKPAFNTRPWQQPSFSHFSLPSPPSPASAASTSSAVAPPAPRGALAIGVSAPSPPPAAPSQQSQIKQPLQGAGTAPSSPIWPTGVPTHQLRPSQASPRPQVGSSSQPLSVQPQTQPWQSSGTPVKPPLPTPSIRPMQQRPYTPQQQPTSTSQQSAQSLAAIRQQEQLGQTFTKQALAHQPVAKGAGPGSQRPVLGMSHPGGLHAGAPSRAHPADVEVSTNRIISKRSIRDIAHQIDPSETLDPEVEDILMDIAEDYLESVVTFGCSLAKHRKSSTLEVKDVLLHVERNWSMALPGFGGDEIKTYKKPVVTDVHKERLAAVKKSIMAADKNSGAPATGGAKSHLAKGLPASSSHP